MQRCETLAKGLQSAIAQAATLLVDRCRKSMSRHHLHKRARLFAAKTLPVPVRFQSMSRKEGLTVTQADDVVKLSYGVQAPDLGRMKCMLCCRASLPRLPATTSLCLHQAWDVAGPQGQLGLGPEMGCQPGSWRAPTEPTSLASQCRGGVLHFAAYDNTLLLRKG